VGGSNGYRTRARRARVAALAVETGLEITAYEGITVSSEIKTAAQPHAAAPGRRPEHPVYRAGLLAARRPL
jgi:hypothetical protein